MESLARLTDLCQAAAPAVTTPTGSGGGEVFQPDKFFRLLFEPSFISSAG